MTMTYLEKAIGLEKYFGIYGKGNFDISTEELAHIIEFLCTKEHPQYLEVNLKELYDRLYKIRLG